MSVEILPASSDGLETTLTRVTIPGNSTVETKIVTGTRAAILVEEADRIAASAEEGISGLTYREQKGRGTLDIQYSRMAVVSNPIDGDSIQELYGVDIVRDILTAPYFKSLTTNEISDIMKLYEARDGLGSGVYSDKEKTLYGHLMHGDDSWVETRYEFRQTWQVSSTKELNQAASNPNTIQALPALNSTMQKLIDSLPEGQWLKKPIQVQQAGRRGWVVSLTYQWAKQWSIIYVGDEGYGLEDAFTGIDPE